MQNLDREILACAAEWLRAGRDVWLCTVVRTYGSSPRPAGSLLAYAGPAYHMGSLSGGCVEDELLARLDSGEQSSPAVLQYGVTRAESERLGLPCGGTLEVLVEQLRAADTRRRQALQRIIDALTARRCIERYIDLETGAWRLREVPVAAPLRQQGTELCQTLGPAYRLLLVGAGEVARWVARFALSLDYKVMVTDPRSDMLEQWDIPEVQRLSGMPDDVVRKHANDPYSIVITLTHDPRIDDMALLEALPGQAWYVGALGSARTSARRRERLQQLDLDAEAVARLHAPVGLPIGSKRPPEIAIAILAELTQLRALRDTHP